MAEIKTIQNSIRQLSEAEYPWNLLLEADPSREMIQRYISSATVFGLLIEGKVVGVLVLAHRGASVEICNIAIDPELRGKGLGRNLLLHAINFARERGYARINIGTGNSSLGQLYLYQSVGFRIVGIERDFFVQNYKERIEENGLQCLDLLRLSIELKD